MLKSATQNTFADRQEQTTVPRMKFQFVYRLTMARIVLQQTENKQLRLTSVHFRTITVFILS